MDRRQLNAVDPFHSSQATIKLVLSTWSTGRSSLAWITSSIHGGFLNAATPSPAIHLILLPFLSFIETIHFCLFPLRQI